MNGHPVQVGTAKKHFPYNGSNSYVLDPRGAKKRDGLSSCSV